MNKLVIFAALLLGACAATPQDAGKPFDLASLTANDLAVAIADAQAHNDKIAVACYTALSSHLGEIAKPSPQIAGVISAYQKGRDIHRSIGAGVPEDVHIACAPMVLDAEALLVKMGIAFVPFGGVLQQVPIGVR